MLNKKKNNKGFTLVELLVVIAIIGILAVVAVPALLKNIDKSRAAKVEANYSAIKSAITNYYTDNGTLYKGENTGVTLDDLSIDKNGLGDQTYTITVTGQSTATLEVSGLTDNVETLLVSSLKDSLSGTETAKDKKINLQLVSQ